MTRKILAALLVSAILAGCSDIDTPTTVVKPNYPPPDTTKTDTSTVPAPLPDNQIPKGQVNAPYLVLLLRNWPQSNIYLEKYRLDGTARDMFIPGVFDPGAPWGFPDLSPKGDKMAFVHEDSIFILDVSTMNKTFINKSGKGMGLVTMSRDGAKLVYSAWGTEWLEDFYVVNAVAGATPVKIKNVPVGDVYVADISPDGSKITYDVNGYVYVSDITGDNRVKVSTLNGVNSLDYSPIFNKAGDKVIFLSGNYSNPPRLMMAPVKENGESEAVVITELATSGLALSIDYVLSGDGQYVYAVGSKGSESGVYQIPLTGGAVVRIIPKIGDKNWEIIGMHFVEE